MKAGSVTTPTAIRSHMAKLKRRAKQITETRQVAKILMRFVEADRPVLFLEIAPFFPFPATFPTPDQFRQAFMNAHEIYAERLAKKQQEERDRTPPPAPRVEQAAPTRVR